jgi:hypothetical protein
VGEKERYKVIIILLVRSKNGCDNFL